MMIDKLRGDYFGLAGFTRAQTFQQKRTEKSVLSALSARLERATP
jgi:hypothetical protein